MIISLIKHGNLTQLPIAQHLIDEDCLVGSLSLSLNSQVLCSETSKWKAIELG